MTSSLLNPWLRTHPGDEPKLPNWQDSAASLRRCSCSRFKGSSRSAGGGGSRSRSAAPAAPRGSLHLSVAFRVWRWGACRTGRSVLQHIHRMNLRTYCHRACLLTPLGGSCVAMPTLPLSHTSPPSPSPWLFCSTGFQCRAARTNQRKARRGCF